MPWPIGLAVILAPIPLNIAAWRRFTRLKSAHTPTVPWQKHAAGLGLIANSVAIAIPWAMFLYGFVALNFGVSIGLLDSLNLNFAIESSLALAAISAFCGAIGHRRIRPLLICAGLLAGGFWFVIPHGVL